MSCAVFFPPSSATRASCVTASRRAFPAEARGAAGVARAAHRQTVADAEAVLLGRRSVASVALGGLLAAIASPALPSRAVENAKRAAGDTGRPVSATTRRRCPTTMPACSRTETGLLFQDLRFGEGARVVPGKRVTADWDAYTFYLSHVMQARNLPKGGDFDGENAERFLRFVPGDGSVIPAFDDAAVAGIASAAFGASSCGRTNLPIPEFYRNAAADSTRASAPCPRVCPAAARWSSC